VKKYLFLVVFTSCLSGCATTGTNVSEKQTAAFQVGVATESDVEGRLGSPQTKETDSSGTIKIGYVFAKASYKASTFIPVVGLFTGGLNEETNTVYFTFGSDGKLQKTSTQAGKIDVKTGL